MRAYRTVSVAVIAMGLLFSAYCLRPEAVSYSQLCTAVAAIVAAVAAKAYGEHRSKAGGAP
jgi:hypothetical protein